MMTPLQKQLNTRIQNMRIPVRQLEREAGLKANAITNILRGESKKPSAESLVAIARVLECTVEDLLEAQKIIPRRQEKMGQVEAIFKEGDDKLPIEDVDLFSKATGAVLCMAQKKEKTLSYEKFLFLAREVYRYSIEHSLDEVDDRFAGWIIDRTLEE